MGFDEYRLLRVFNAFLYFGQRLLRDWNISIKNFAYDNFGKGDLKATAQGRRESRKIGVWVKKGLVP